MLKLTRFDGSQIVVNFDLIELVEKTPDTVSSLTTNRKILVRESVDEVIEKAIEFKRMIFSGERWQ